MKGFLTIMPICLSAFSTGVGAAALRLDYRVTDLSGGQYQYDFELVLVLDNADNSWSSGQGWGGSG